MAAGPGVSGIGVAAITAGALLMYAGIQDLSILDTLRTITSGKLPKAEPKEEGPGTTAARAALVGGGGTAGGSGVIQAGATGAGPFPQLAQAALSHRGVPYRWGGTTPAGFDCSGLVQYAYKQLGITAPRTTGPQQVWSQHKTIPAASAGAGDLVFWPGHVAIVVAPGTVVHAPGTGKLVRTEKVETAGPRGTSPTFKRYVGPKPGGTSSGSKAPKAVAT
ncbi:C40 family peptidase [Streptomyces albidoflavus]|uniref:C40 family peptidase n=1 Tax=Streptomyces albidoflavus TaxID=1886 RepID=UPI003329A14F